MVHTRTMKVPFCTEPVRGRGSRPVRQTPERLDAAILDTAAEVFARHGFTSTSVQQVADAVGYSKTGLLRRFPSKQALYEAVLDHVGEMVGRLLADVDPSKGVTPSEVLRRTTTAGFANPGTVMFLFEALDTGVDLPGSQRCRELADSHIAVLTAGLTDPRDRLRALLALQLIANTALLSIDPDAPALDLSPAEVQDVVLEAARDVLGPRSG